MIGLDVLVALASIAAVAAVARMRARPGRTPTPKMIAEALARLSEGDTDVRLQIGRSGSESRVASLVNALAHELSAHDEPDDEHGETDPRSGDAVGHQVVAVLSVDRFARLRQQIGSGLAHRTLKLIQDRVLEAEPAASLGRIGRAGVEFLLPGIDPESADARLAALQSAIEQPIRIDGQYFELSTTIGYAVCPSGRLRESAMIERAELAMDRANALHIPLARFGPEDEVDSGDRLALTRDLTAAVEGGDFFLCYQPKLGCRDNEVGQVEALIRWNHPVRGVVPPNDFIALAESTGTIRPITRWVIEAALVDQVRLRELGFNIEISVNISGRLLGDAAFATWALETIERTGGSICFELTETSVIDDPDRAVAHLKTFASAGIRIAIDDYGSGLSSLAYLKELPAHELKIDKLFISGLATSQRDPLLVRSTIDLAHALDLKVTAEGVESPAALALLKMMGCDFAQGYLIAKPLRFDDLVAFLTGRRSQQETGDAPATPFLTAFFAKG